MLPSQQAPIVDTLSPVNRVRELRLERAKIAPKAFTIQALANRIGVAEGVVRSWERGDHRPTQRHARALARELSVSVEELGLDQDAG